MGNTNGPVCVKCLGRGRRLKRSDDTITRECEFCHDSGLASPEIVAETVCGSTVSGGEELEQPWPPDRVWLPTGVVMLAAVSPELENVEGAWWVRADIAVPQAEIEQMKAALTRAWKEGRHGPMCDRARCVCWKAEARSALVTPLPTVEQPEEARD